MSKASSIISRRHPSEHLATSIRKVEPMGGGLVRLYFAIERNAAWEDQATIIMPTASIDDALGFAIGAARDLAAQDGDTRTVPLLGTVN